MKQSLSALAVAGVLVAFAAAPAFGAEPEDISEVLVSESLSQLGVETIPEGVLSSLTGTLSETFDAGVLGAESVDVATRILDEGASPELLETVVSQNRSAQEAVWEEEADVIREAFSELAEDFAQCRGAAEGCSDEFAERFRSEWTVRETERIEALTTEVEALEGLEREAALERLTARIERFEQKTSSPPGPPAGGDNPQSNPNSPQQQGDSLTRDGSPNASSGRQVGDSSGPGDVEGSNRPNQPARPSAPASPEPQPATPDNTDSGEVSPPVRETPAERGKSADDRKSENKGNSGNSRGSAPEKSTGNS